MMPSNGKILQLQNFSVNDGEGLRTTIFFPGCPLRCQWCANPEGYTSGNKILYISSRCVSCGRCKAVCPEGVGIDLNTPDERKKCTACGKCTAVCLEKARKNTTTEVTVEAVIKQLESQMQFFYGSGGGVTYSGGECTMQPVFLNELVNAVYDLGLNQAIETSGYFSFAEMEETFAKLDSVFIDIKLMDSAKHRFFTGVDNDLILNNISRLGQKRKGIVVRVPTIVGVNADIDNIRATAKFVRNNVQDPCMELLPYHHYGEDKFKQLGMDRDFSRFDTPDRDYMNSLVTVIENEGVRVISYK